MEVIPNDISPIIFNRQILYGLKIMNINSKKNQQIIILDFSYKCKNRKKYGLVIKVSKDELKKYLENKNYKINYSMNEKKRAYLQINRI